MWFSASAAPSSARARSHSWEMRRQNCSSTRALPAAQSSPIREEHFQPRLWFENSMYFPEILAQLRPARVAALCNVALRTSPLALPQSLPAGIESGHPWEHPLAKSQTVHSSPTMLAVLALLALCRYFQDLPQRCSWHFQHHFQGRIGPKVLCLQ